MEDKVHRMREKKQVRKVAKKRERKRAKNVAQKQYQHPVNQRSIMDAFRAVKGS